MDNKYCSTCFRTGEELDAALQKALKCDNNAARAEAAANRAEEAAQNAIAIVNTANGEVVAVNDSAACGLRGLSLYGKTTQNGTPGPDNPVPLESVGADGTVDVTVNGGNLFKPNTKTATGYGLTWDCVDGLWHVYGTTNAAYPRVFLDTPAVFEAGEYTMSVVFVKGGWSDVQRIALFNSAENKYFQVFDQFPVETQTFGKTKFERLILGNIPVGTTIDVQFCIMVNAGNKALPYEPYKEAQTLTAQTPNGLPGIPVSSGGNYTDENGQQWICDEVDLARGKYVQRVWTKIYDGSEDELWVVVGAAVKRHITYDIVPAPKPAANNYTSVNALCSHFPVTTYNQIQIAYANCFGMNDAANTTLAFVHEDFAAETDAAAFRAWLSANPVTLVYEIATPIETDLTAEELAQYAALRTNSGNTTVFNDSGAGMGVSYVADTKTYIDNKFAELQAAVLSMGGNV